VSPSKTVRWPEEIRFCHNGFSNLEYCDALRAAGKEVEVLLSRRMSHSFYLNKYAVDMDPATGERARELIDAIRSFIARH